jgi:hypothetical protein
MAYKTYTPTNYPSGSGTFDVYIVEIAAITGGTSQGAVVKFSNPFVIFGAYNANAREYVGFEDFQVTYAPSLWSYLVPSGILKQTEAGGGVLQENGVIPTIVGETWKMFWYNDYLRPSIGLTSSPIGGEVISGNRYPNDRNTLDLLKQMGSNFDSVCYPANQFFPLEPAGQRIFMLMAVKRGNNQPFFQVAE